MQHSIDNLSFWGHIIYRVGLSGRDYGCFTKSIFLRKQKKKMPRHKAGHWALSLQHYCIVGLRSGLNAPRPLGGLMSGCRNQHAEPDLIVRAYHTICGVLRLFRPSTRLLTTGAGQNPLILSALLNNPRYLTGGYPATVIIAQSKPNGKPFPAHTIGWGDTSPPHIKGCATVANGKNSRYHLLANLTGRAYEAYTRSFFGKSTILVPRPIVCPLYPVPLPRTRA